MVNKDEYITSGLLTDVTMKAAEDRPPSFDASAAAAFLFATWQHQFDAAAVPIWRRFEFSDVSYFLVSVTIL